MEKREVKIGFVLKKIVTEQFAIIEEAYSADKKLVYNTNLKIGVDQKKKRIVMISGFRFEQDKIPFLMIEGGCHFQINDVAWESFVRNESESLIIPHGFLGHLAMITIGTVRGILHAKTENTEFNKFLIPTINVLELVHTDLEIKKDTLSLSE